VTSDRKSANFAFPHVSVCLLLEMQERKSNEKASSTREKQAEPTNWAILSNIGNWMNITGTLIYYGIVFEGAEA
jgi:hypothetical protein